MVTRLICILKRLPGSCAENSLWLGNGEWGSEDGEEATEAGHVSTGGDLARAVESEGVGSTSIGTK